MGLKLFDDEKNIVHIKHHQKSRIVEKVINLIFIKPLAFASGFFLSMVS